MTSARDYGRAVKPGGDLWKLRRKPGGDVYEYREALRERYRIADAKWTASGYTSKAALGEVNRARLALQTSLQADLPPREGVKRKLTLFELFN